MAFGWFRDTSDNKLVAAADSELTPPTGHDFILKSTIEAVYTGEIWQLGTWDGTTYEPPAGILVPYDTTTDTGELQAAALGLHEQLLAWASGVDAEALFQSARDVGVAHDFLTYAHHASYVVFNSATWTMAQKLAWANKMATGASDVVSPFTFFQVAHLISEDMVPTEACAWVNPDTMARRCS